MTARFVPALVLSGGLLFPSALAAQTSPSCLHASSAAVGRSPGDDVGNTPVAWYAGQLEHVALTDAGRQALGNEPVALLRVELVGPTEDETTRLAFFRRLRSPQQAMSFRLTPGTYRVVLYATRFEWPKTPEDTDRAPIPACDALTIRVLHTHDGLWAPNPQVSLAFVGTRVEAGVEAFVTKWGVFTSLGVQARRTEKPLWLGRLEARYAATRGYWSVGARMNDERRRLEGSIGVGLELPPLKRHPLWFVADLGMRRHRSRLATEFSAGVRWDVFTVKR